MGTKHGYTEKECKVCHKVKTREEFPTYGGLTCRDCMRTKEAANQKSRYQRDKKNPEWVAKNRQKSIDYSRKRKTQREEQSMGSEMENGARIQGMAREVVEGINGPTGQINGWLADALQFCEQAINAAQDPVGEVGNILGDGHQGIDAIAGPTAAVVEALESLQGAINQAIAQVETVRGHVDTLGFVYDNVGSQIQRGGGY